MSAAFLHAPLSAHRQDVRFSGGVCADIGVIFSAMENLKNAINLGRQSSLGGAIQFVGAG